MTGPASAGLPGGWLARIRGRGLRAELLRSHLAVALLGLAMLGLALGALLWSRSVTASLAGVRAPTVREAGRAGEQVQRSLAALRGYVVLGDPRLTEERRKAWSEGILPALAALEALRPRWRDAATGLALERASAVLEELRDWQWWIEEVAHAPGNEPARAEWTRRVQPVAQGIEDRLEALVVIESARGAGAGRLAALGELRLSLARGGAALERHLRAGDRREAATWREELARLDRGVSAYSASAGPAEERELLRRLRREVLALGTLGEEVLRLRAAPDWNAAQHLLAQRAVPLSSRASRFLGQLSSEQARAMGREARRARVLGQAAIGLCLLSMAGLVLGSWRIATRGADRILRPIARLSEATSALAAGRTDVALPAGTDELGRLSEGFDRMRSSLRLAERTAQVEEALASLEGAFRDIRSTAAELGDATAALVVASEAQTMGLHEQSAAVQQSLVASEELRGRATEVRQQAEGLAQEAERSEATGQRGRQAVEDAAQAMTAVSEQVVSVGRRLAELVDRIESVAAIVTALDDIAERTNMLALNAAVVASHAGEHGRGFVVITDEIKALAGESRAATQDAHRILREILMATEPTVRAAEEGDERAREAVGVVRAADDTIRSLTETLAGSVDQTAHIAVAVHRQLAGASQIGQAMKQVHGANLRNRESIATIEETARRLRALGAALEDRLASQTREGAGQPADPSGAGLQ